MNLYLPHESNSALYAFTAAPNLKFAISNPKGKIVQKVKFLSVNRNSDLIPKLYSTHQDELGDVLSFQNRALEAYIPRGHAKRCKKAYLEK